MIKTILKTESIFIFLCAIFIYFKLQGDWLLFIILLLLPDISMIGYLKNNKIGAFIYNIVHNFVLGILIILFGYLVSNQLTILVGLVFIAHVGLDRACGFGLKKTTGFKDTHLGLLRG